MPLLRVAQQFKTSSIAWASKSVEPSIFQNKSVAFKAILVVSRDAIANTAGHQNVNHQLKTSLEAFIAKLNDVYSLLLNTIADLTTKTLAAANDEALKLDAVLYDCDSTNNEGILKIVNEGILKIVNCPQAAALKAAWGALVMYKNVPRDQFVAIFQEDSDAASAIAKVGSNHDKLSLDSEIQMRADKVVELAMSRALTRPLKPTEKRFDVLQHVGTIVAAINGSIPPRLDMLVL